MGQAEDEAGLVRPLYAAQEGGLAGVRHHQEAGEVVLVVVDVSLQHLHAIHPGGVVGANGGPSPRSVAGDILRGACRVLGLHGLHLGMAGEEGAALREGHGMGMHLGDGVPVVLGQAAYGMLYVQLVLPHHGGTALTQQLVIMEQ